MDAALLHDRIADLRARGDHVAALAAARDLTAVLEREPAARPFEVGDATRLVTTLEQVCAMSDDDRTAFTHADTLTPTIDAATHALRHRDALSVAEEQLALRERLLGRTHQETARSLEAIGWALLELHDTARAKDLVHELIRIRRDLLEPDHPEIAKALFNAGALHWRLADLPAAEPFLRDAVSLWSHVYDEHPSLAFGLFCLGRVVHETGRFAAAEPLYRAALAMQRRLDPDDPHTVPLCLVHLARLAITQGDDDAGEAMLREAVEICDRLGDRALEAGLVARHGMAGALAWRGDHAAGDALRRKDLEHARKVFGDRHPNIANRLREWANSYLTRGDFQEAEVRAREALEIRRERFGPTHPTIAATLHTLAWAHAGLGDRSRAIDDMRTAITLVASMGVASRPLLIECLTSLGDLQREEGALDESAVTLLDAARRFEVARARLRHGLGRAAFATSPYMSLALTQLLLQRGDEAWASLERGLGRVLADLVLDSPRAAGTSAERTRESEAVHELARAEAELHALEHAEPDDDEAAPVRRRRIDESRERLARAELEWAQLHEARARQHPLSEGEALDLTRVRRALAEGEAIVGWLDVRRPGLRDRAWGYVIRSTGAVRWVDLTSDSGSRARELARAYRREMREHGLSALGAPSPNALTETKDAILRSRVAPLLPHLEGLDSLVVIAAGDLVGVPIEDILARQGDVAPMDVCYSPSAALHTWLSETRRRTDRASLRALLVGDPPFKPEHVDTDEPPAAHDGELTPATVARGLRIRTGSLPRLRGSRTEVDRISRFFSTHESLVGRAATEEALQRRAADGTLRAFDVLHIATHAVVNTASPELSALVLSQVDLPDAEAAARAGEPVQRGLVTARDVVHTWTLDAELVTLSACDTGTGRHVPGEGLVGFVHAFMQAGARSLLVSLWPVDDQATQLLMERFYESWLREGMSKAGALREAKAWLRTATDAHGKRRFDHPYYGSPFILFGDPH